MEERILTELDSIENKHNVKILYACESGSRAWGFPSLDSDYDVRFIYVHPMEWYLGLSEKRDVIELPIDDSLDINGWDIRKTLRLLKKSNSPLLEWLSSPIVYRKLSKDMQPLLDLAPKAFLSETSCRHYLSLAGNVMLGIKTDAMVKKKKYLYALRAILCTEWIVKYEKQPPMLIQELMAEFLPQGGLRAFVDDLIFTKRSEVESQMIERSQDLDDYLASRLSHLQQKIPKNSHAPGMEEYDLILRRLLKP